MTDSRRPPSAHFDAAPDDFDHPEYEQLASFVDDRLDPVDREWMVSHVETCEVCKEDVDDLIHVRSSILAPTPAVAPAPVAIPPHKRRWIKHAIGFGAVAAGLALAIWIGRGPSRAVSEPVVPAVSEAPRQPASPAPVAVSSPVSPPVLPLVLPLVLNKDEQGRVTRALASGRLELPANMDVLRGHTGTLLGPGSAPSSFAPSAPIGTAVIELRPQFSWTAMAGATRYSVTVFDERFREVEKSGSLTGTTWTPSRDLPRGRVLAWQISAVTRDGIAISPAPPQPEARFVILDAATGASVARNRTRLATEPVALGLTLAKTGLFAEAESVFERALADARYDPSQVRALIARLRAR